MISARWYLGTFPYSLAYSKCCKSISPMLLAQAGWESCPELLLPITALTPALTWCHSARLHPKRWERMKVQGASKGEFWNTRGKTAKKPLQLTSARPGQLQISAHSCHVYVYCYYGKGIEGVQEQRRNVIYTHRLGVIFFFANGS